MFINFFIVFWKFVAYLKNTVTGEKTFLFGRHIVGKLPESNTILRCAESSPIHAIINWHEDTWQIKDISAKGVYINGIKITPAVQCLLRKGDKINFGSINSATWEFLNEDPPHCMLIPITPNLLPITLDDKDVALPSAERPFAIMSKSRYGYWIYESPERTHQLKSGDIVGDSENQWQFIDWNFFERVDSTQAIPPKKSELVSFSFKVSQDEEHVSLTIQVGERKILLGERSHHYLLLLLARKKLEDKLRGVANGEQGWVLTSDFKKMLGLSEHHINIQIYRIRKQLSKLYPSYFEDHNIIERRTGVLRFSGDLISIQGGFSGG